MRMSKRIIAISLTFILVFTGIAISTTAMAQDELTPQQVQQVSQDTLFQEVANAVEQGLISQVIADRITEAWEQETEDGRPRLYQRVMNFLQTTRDRESVSSSR